MNRLLAPPYESHKSRRRLQRVPPTDGRPKRRARAGKVLLASIVLFATVSVSADESQDSPQQRFGRRDEQGGVYKDRITPHWFATNTQFWYRNELKGRAREFILVDAEKGTRQRAFDHAKLAKALSTAAGKDFNPNQLPFENIEFAEDNKSVRFEAAEKNWKCDLTTYECTESTAAPTDKASAEGRRISEFGLAGLTGGSGDRPKTLIGGNSASAEGGTTNSTRRRSTERDQNRAPRSPDNKWTARVEEHNVWLRSEGGEEFQLSTDGETNKAYGLLEWSPDSKALVGWRIVPGERKEVYLVQSSPTGGGRAKLETRPYALPGDKFATYELNVFDLTSRKQIKPHVDKFEHEWVRPRLRWSKEARRFAYEMSDRGHQRFRAIEVDAESGTPRKHHRRNGPRRSSGQRMQRT